MVYITYSHVMALILCDTWWQTETLWIYNTQMY